MSLDVHFCKLCFANLNDQLGVANFAYTLGSADLVYNLKHRFAYVLFHKVSFTTLVCKLSFANSVYTFSFCKRC